MHCPYKDLAALPVPIGTPLHLMQISKLFWGFTAVDGPDFGQELYRQPLAAQKNHGG